jgi:PKD repeat protein
MKAKLLLLFIAALLIVGSASATITVTADKFSGTAPLSVTFSYTTDIYSPVLRVWHFGDGTTSDASSPSHVFASAGIYNVSLGITNATTTYWNNNTRISVDSSGTLTSVIVYVRDISSNGLLANSNVTVKEISTGQQYRIELPGGQATITGLTPAWYYNLSAMAAGYQTYEKRIFASAQTMTETLYLSRSTGVNETGYYGSEVYGNITLFFKVRGSGNENPSCPSPTAFYDECAALWASCGVKCAGALPKSCPVAIEHNMVWDLPLATVSLTNGRWAPYGSVQLYSIPDRTAITGSDGTAIMSGVPDGAIYTVTYSKAGFEPVSFRTTFYESYGTSLSAKLIPTGGLLPCLPIGTGDAGDEYFNETGIEPVTDYKIIASNTLLILFNNAPMFLIMAIVLVFVATFMMSSTGKTALKLGKVGWKMTKNFRPPRRRR